jgi:hypothetical protein
MLLLAWHLLLWPVLNQYQLKYDSYLYSALLVLLLVLCTKGMAGPCATRPKKRFLEYLNVLYRPSCCVTLTGPDHQPPRLNTERLA